MDKPKFKLEYILSLSFFVLFLILSILLMVVDKGTTTDGVVVGLSTINMYFYNIITYNNIFYLLSKLLGILVLLIAFIFVVLGVFELIKRKSLKEVDKEIMLLGFIYIILFILYVAFVFIVINYRPINDKELESSFPSSHTMLALTISLTSIYLMPKYISNSKLKLLIIIGVSVVGVLTIIFRFLSGVHWFTDILGGIFISLSLSFLYKGLIKEA